MGDDLVPGRWGETLWVEVGRVSKVGAAWVWQGYVLLPGCGEVEPIVLLWYIYVWWP